MAFYDTADAIYGSGTYGTASYGRVTPVISLTGVGATALTRTLHLDVFEVDITEPLYNAQGATGSVGSLTLNTAAGLTGVSATGSINTLGVGVDVTLSSVSATASTNTVTENTAAGLTGVVGTLGFNGSGISVRSVNTVSVSLNAITGSIGTVGLSNTKELTSILGSIPLGTIKVNVSELATGVSATGALTAGTVGISNKFTPDSVVGTIPDPSVQPNVKEEIQQNAVSGVSATVSVSAPKINITEVLVSIQNTGSIGDLGTTAIQFDFQAVASRYSRRRTVILPRVA